MGTTAEKLIFLGETKSLIRDSIIAKGVDVPVETTFRDYATKVDEITQGGAPVYARPGDWLDIDSLVVDNDHKFVGLFAIYEDSNFISVFASQDYTVDWGDGVVENFNDGTQCYHEYDYADFAGTESTRGYRQAIVTITPNGGPFTNIDVHRKHNQANLSNAVIPWLDIKMSGSDINNATIGETTYSVGLLEQFDFIGTNNFSSTDMVDFFYGCSSFQNLKSLDTSNCSSLQNMFEDCVSLRTLRELDLTSCDTLTNLFNGCVSLTHPPSLATSGVSKMTGMFSNCSSLQVAPMMDTSSVTRMNLMFNGCSALETVPLYNTPLVDAMNSMFFECDSLKTVPLFDTTSVTTMQQMFYFNFVLQSVPLFDTTSLTRIDGMFFNCHALSTVELMDVTNVTNMANAFFSCKSLYKGALIGTSLTFNYSGSKLSQSALVDIFNGLATVVGQTINITNNWGAPLLTAPERAIATDKGWTITG